MKIRLAHVSNSSSSRFVIYGYSVDKLGLSTEELVKKRYPDFNSEDEDSIFDKLYEFRDDKVVYLSDDGDGYIGFQIAHIEDGYLDSSEITLDELKEIGQQLKERLKIDKEPSLITGTRAC